MYYEDTAEDEKENVSHPLQTFCEWKEVVLLSVLLQGVQKIALMEFRSEL